MPEMVFHLYFCLLLFTSFTAISLTFTHLCVYLFS